MKKIVSIIISVVLIAGLGGYFFYQRTLAKISISKQQDRSERLAQNTEISRLFQEKEPFTILLLGIGGGEHEGAYLTDSIIAAQINPRTEVVNLISLPRDLLVRPDPLLQIGDKWKLNAYYAIGLNDEDFPSKQEQYKAPVGGGNLSKRIVGDISGLDPMRFIVVEFDGFTKIIDVIGGIDVAVEQSFTDFEYPLDGHEDDLCGGDEADLPLMVARLGYEPPYEVFPCRYQTVSFEEGVMHMNGDQALAFARSRHASGGEGSDFARSTRQKQIVTSLKDKLLSPSIIPKLPGLLDVVTDHIETDMSPQELHALILRAKALGGYSINTITPTNANALIDSTDFNFGYTLLPRPNIQLDTWIQEQLQ